MNAYIQETPQFTCPECGCHQFGTRYPAPKYNRTGFLIDQGPLIRFCHGHTKEGLCKFSWAEKATTQ